MPFPSFIVYYLNGSILFVCGLSCLSKYSSSMYMFQEQCLHMALYTVGGFSLQLLSVCSTHSYSVLPAHY